ncbi:MAG: hypothetical protein JW735_05885 [Prolixibacteraceae bacterium]|jgi:hypothetical protein|nr:hypothetical protein [Prolixibacteraceae bacterium]
MCIKLLQIEIIGPQGDKLIWVFIIIALIAVVVYLRMIKQKFSLQNFRKKVIVKVEKNKVYHPDAVHIIIENKTAKAIDIENPVIRFKLRSKSKAFKIKAVNTRNIYPLYLENGKTHHLPVSLEPFYNFDNSLKKFTQLRIEFNYNKSQSKKSRYILLKPTLFKSAHQ